ncbi:golgin subfamily A member 6-like protein 22 [Prorops nasuta]|uniref:golgin subfamily A member 6-like protein 22 n=1 Tax=Prorops nasuta TaxID=863751 RepID=UPI0034CEDD89
MEREGERGEKEKGKEEEVGREVEKEREGGRMNIGRLIRDRGEGERRRTESTGSMEEFLRGKREEREGEEERGRGDKWAFKKSARVERSPVRGEEGGMEKVLKAIEGIKEKMDGIEEGKKEILKKIEEVREEIEKDRREWRREIEGLKGRMEELEKREKEREKQEGRVGKENRGQENGEMEERIKRLEWEREREERERRRNNIIMWGMEREEGGEERLKEEVGRIMEMIGVKGGVREVRVLRGMKGEERKGIEVKLESREVKRKVMEGKNKLKGRKERIEDDLTWEERRIMGKVREIAEGQRRKGERVRVGYMKVWVNNEEWRWNEWKGGLWNKEGKGWNEEEAREGENFGGREGKGNGKR